MAADDLLFHFAVGLALTNAISIVCFVILFRFIRSVEYFSDRRIDLLRDYTRTRINTLHDTIKLIVLRERIDKLEQDQAEGRE